MRKTTQDLMKRAAMAGLGAVSGFKAAKGPAQLAARVPYVGTLLGVTILIAGAVAGGTSGAGNS